MPGRKGYYLRWFENGKRKHKQVNTLKEAEAFRARQYMLLNSDVYASVSIPMAEAIKEYVETYDTRKLAKESGKMAKRFLDDFTELAGVRETKEITQKMADFWVSKQKDKSPYTVNKGLGRLQAFLTWCKRRGYQTPPVDIFMQKQPKRGFRCPSNEAINALIKRCPSATWRVSILLYLTTGLRKNDLRRISKSDIDLDGEYVRTSSLKTGKIFERRPIHKIILPELKSLIAASNDFPFVIKNARKEWDSFCGEFTFQMLRKTHATLMQTIGGISTAQKSLEHEDARTTLGYTDEEYVFRWKINQLPVIEWIKDDNEKG